MLGTCFRCKEQKVNAICYHSMMIPNLRVECARRFAVTYLWNVLTVSPLHTVAYLFNLLTVFIYNLNVDVMLDTCIKSWFRISIFIPTKGSLKMHLHRIFVYFVELSCPPQRCGGPMLVTAAVIRTITSAHASVTQGNLTAVACGKYPQYSYFFFTTFNCWFSILHQHEMAAPIKYSFGPTMNGEARWGGRQESPAHWRIIWSSLTPVEILHPAKIYGIE